MSDNDLETFLKNIGFENLYSLFVENQVTTVKALKSLDEESLLSIGLKPLVIKPILKHLNEQNQNMSLQNSSIIQNQRPSKGQYQDQYQGLPQSQVERCHSNQQMILLQQQQLLKEFETEKRFSEMEYQFQLLKIKNESNAALQEVKTIAEIDKLKQAAEFREIEFGLNKKIMEKEYEGKLKVLEIKLNAKESPSKLPSSAPAKETVDSVLLSDHFFGIIQGWLGNPCQWVLLYRGTQNGFSALKFHNLCDHVGPTVTIIRSTMGYLFGGYNPISWTSTDSYRPGEKSFIFTLTNPYGAPPTPFYYSGPYGAYDNPSNLPCFGVGIDICIYDNCHLSDCNYTNFPSSYIDTLGYSRNTFTGNHKFTVSEIEVFSVKK